MATYRTGNAGGGTSGTGNRTATITPAVGDLFLVGCCATGNSNQTPTCTDDNGGTYTLIRIGALNGSADMLSTFVRDALLTNTTSTTVTVATGSNTSAEIAIIAVSGMAKVGSAAVLQSARQANQSSGTTPAPTFASSCQTENMTIGFVGNGTNPATLTPPINFVERADVGQATPSCGLEVITRDSGFTGTTVTWGGTSASNYSDVIIELDGSATGTLTKTLASASLSSAGIAEAAGTLSTTLASATISSAGTADVVGTLSKSLAGASLTSAGIAEATGVLSKALDGATISAAGTAEVVGSLTKTLAAASISSGGTAEIQGTISASLAAVGIASAGTSEISGTSSVTLASAGLSAAGTTEVVGSLVKSLADATLTSAGMVTDPLPDLTGTLTVTLDDVRIVANNLVIPTHAARLSVGGHDDGMMTGGGSATATLARGGRGYGEV